jgi:hypothetical protein
MTNEEFQDFLDEQLCQIKKVLAGKNIHYARGNDKLHNFKKAAVRLDCTPEKALQGMLVKHQVSIDDMIDDLDSNVYHSLPLWREKIIDAINYHLLLFALIEERKSLNANGIFSGPERV